MDSFSKYHIDSVIEGGSKNAWHLTGFYGKPNAYRRSEGWSMLCMLGSKPTLPWCCLADFNELLEGETYSLLYFRSSSNSFSPKS